MKALWEPLKDTKAGKMIAKCAGDDYVLKWDELKACLKKAGKNPDDIEKAHEIWIKGVETHNLNRQARYTRLNAEDLHLLFRQAARAGIKTNIF